MTNKTFTRCWCCSQLKVIDLDLTKGERLCQDCIDEMEKRENEKS
jgi:hypothetical protein